jgi:hypothetical protein
MCVACLFVRFKFIYFQENQLREYFKNFDKKRLVALGEITAEIKPSCWSILSQLNVVSEDVIYLKPQCEEDDKYHGIFCLSFIFNKYM